ncbi:hypothetical protein HNR65_000494 [Desulfosalsimonas propionicica]|uniref:RiboL-PSP-HEPN domain-containing protein n=1 Tax=Desulfosalsimonas propionicica TaxID=332175 RepID=A0A7W0HJH8_9BACT|nr:HEPN domain-containing protein [Desulfosalsimonas propionicica]MBA2880187.1 hypothetical protein [Desulfosalsimonas propionicica]
MALKNKMRRRAKKPPHIDSLKTNFQEIDRILEIHGEISGSGPGYKHNVQVLNKSAVVLLLACWEAYIEDLADNSFYFMLSKSKQPQVFPDHVLSNAAKEIKKSNSDVWSLANMGWKTVMQDHKNKILEKYTVQGAFNTPSPKNIDALFSNLIGYKSISRTWYWPAMSIENSKKKLEELIELRGSIAHRVQSAKKVTKTHVKDSKAFIFRLAIISNNRVVKYIEDQVGIKPWRTLRYQKTR